MKKYIYILSIQRTITICLFTLISGIVNAQHNDQQVVVLNEATDSVKVDTMNCHASFPGGYDSMFYYINNTLKYPEEAVKKGKEGKVTLSYSVDEKGKVKNVTIIDDEGLNCKEVVTKLFEGMPEWKPARQNGTKIEKRYTMVISFNLKYAPGGKLAPDIYTFWRG